MYAIDTETGPYPMPPGEQGAWALEPYRSEFYMKLACIAGPGDSVMVLDMSHKDNYVHLQDELIVLAGKEVYCHNAIFDISVLINQYGILNDFLANIRWRDTSILAKWINNSQKDEDFRYSLRNCVEKWLEDHPSAKEFLDMKDNVQDDYAYWLHRVKEDTKLTLALARRLEALLPGEQMKGYITECACLYPLAKGYMQGIEVDSEVVDDMKIIYQARINKGLRELGVQESVIRSPKQLAKLLFETWGLKPHEMTATGAPSTSGPNLKHILLESGDERLQKLLDVKSAITVMNKYINGFKAATKYLNKDKIHPIPRLFNSYTGRMTYTSKLFKKHQVAIALHQLPRKDKMVKRALVAPDGYQFFYSDFAAQELRLMGQFSGDEVIIDTFNDDKDLHSIMTETIYGVPYLDIVEGSNNDVPDIVDKRNCGKLTNLSSMYRIGPKALKDKFFEQYDKLITLREATHYLNSYKKTFKKIPKYWEDACLRAQKHKYAESLSRRRFGINKMDWKGESSAINMPIQGSGIDLAEYQIAKVSREFPDMIFQIQVHDSLTWLIPEDMDPIDIKCYINDLDYSEHFGVNLKLKFPMDCAVGKNLATMRAI